MDLSSVIKLRVDPRQWDRFLSLCQAGDETPGSVLRELLRLEIQRRERRARRPAGADERPDPKLLARLRLLVAEALAEARDWPTMQAALARRGLAYRPKGGGLELASRAGAPLCKGSEAGPAYAELIRRFGAGFPGHPHRHLVGRVLGPSPHFPGSGDSPGPEPEIELIERE